MFGEKVAGYDFPVLNEREVRAGAGILFFVATVVFLGAWHADQLLPAQMMIIAFFLDFAIRVVAPRFAPSLILGRVAVRNQKPEYVAAAPKRFAWFLGLGLATIMLVTMFLHEMSLINFVICGVCILLLFFESAFGICLGCLIYHYFKKEKTLCAGEVCEVRQREPIQELSAAQLAVVALFALAMVASYFLLTQYHHHPDGSPRHPILHQLKGQSPSSPHAHDH